MLINNYLVFIYFLSKPKKYLLWGILSFNNFKYKCKLSIIMRNIFNNREPSEKNCIYSSELSHNIY